MSRWLAVAALLSIVSACRSIPGDSVEEKRAHIDAWEAETMSMLYEQHPETREEVAAAAGYLAVGHRVVKVPIFGGGSGYGVLVDQVGDRRLYVKLTRLDVGGGYGVRDARIVLVLHDPKLLEKAGQTVWSFGAGAEASAKAGDSGVAGGAGTGESGDGYTTYELSESGVSVTWTLHLLKVSAVRSLN